MKSTNNQLMKRWLILQRMHFIFLVLAVSFAFPLVSVAQETIEVHGTVTGEEGEPLPGANVVVKGTTAGVVTNLEGEYTIDAEPGKVLQFSFIGYIPQEVILENQTRIDIVLQLDVTELEQVVVVGYGYMRKVDITGSVATLNNESLEKEKPATIMQALQGKVPGLRIITSDGAPGSDFDMEIRGMSSINASGSPLVIIDGLPGGDISTIDPKDVESISVLKDASSTAIYGSRGANGVVLITTKRGQVGKTHLDVNALYGIQSLPTALDFQDPESFMHTKLAKMYMQTSPDYNADDDPDPNYSYYRAWNERWYEDPSRVTDWQGLIFKPGKRQEYSLTLTSGNDKVRNATSLGLHNNEGIVLTTGYSRGTIRSNTDFQLSDKLKISNNVSLAYRRKKGYTRFEDQGVFVKAGQFSPMIDRYMNFAAVRQWEHSGGTTVTDNPYLVLTQTDVLEDNFDLLGNLEIDYEILNGLRFIGSAGGSYRNFKNEHYESTLLAGSWNSNGYMNMNRDYRYSWRMLAQLVYDLNIGEHSLNATGGFEAQEYGRDVSEQTYINFDQILGKYGINDVEFSTSSPKPYYAFNKNNLASFIGRVQYGFKDRYLFSATVRTDGSSKFGPENAWGVFPAFGIGWRISQENFMQSIDWISNLKLRGSWGQAGNDNIDSYLSLAMYEPNRYYAVFGENRDMIVVPYHPNQIPNFSIGWETTLETNIGLDAGFFNNRLSSSFDWYNRKTIDMLLEVELPAIVGVDSQTQNKGSLQNKGWEFQVDGVILNRSRITWRAGLNLYSNQIKVLELQDEKIRDFQSVNSLIQVGLPLGIKYGYIAEGTVRSQDYQNNAVRITVGDTGNGWGNASVLDITGNGRVDSWDQSVIFHPHASISGGLHSSLKYGPVELYMFFRGSYGSDVYNVNLEQMSRTSNLSRALLQNVGEEMWLPNNRDGKFIGPSSEFTEKFTSFLIEDGSYLKFATLSISFDFPGKWINPLKIAGARMAYTLDNVAVLSNYSWFDPDVNSGGNFRYYNVDRSAYPYSRTHMFTLSLTL